MSLGGFVFFSSVGQKLFPPFLTMVVFSSHLSLNDDFLHIFSLHTKLESQFQPPTNRFAFFFSFSLLSLSFVFRLLQMGRVQCEPLLTQPLTKSLKPRSPLQLGPISFLFMFFSAW